MSQELVAFLRARLDEDEQRQKDRLEGWHARDCESLPDGDHVTYACDCGVPPRILAESDAKRQIVDEYATTCRLRDEAAARIKAAGDHPDPADLDTWDRAEREAAILRGPVENLAAVHAKHPDYREEWRP